MTSGIAFSGVLQILNRPRWLSFCEDDYAHGRRKSTWYEPKHRL
jgi:hypothetical protein